LGLIRFEISVLTHRKNQFHTIKFKKHTIKLEKHIINFKNTQ
jgi:hypothetical protein